MRTFATILLVIVTYASFGQCPDIVRNYDLVVRKVDSVLNTSFKLTSHNTGEWWYYRDTSSRFIRITADDQMKNNDQIVIKVYEDEVDAVMNKLVDSIPAECIKRRNKLLVVTKLFDIDARYKEQDYKRKKRIFMVTITPHDSIYD